MVYFNIFILIVFIILVKSVVIIKESERYLIYRFGKFQGIWGPGLIIVYPFIDKKIKISLKNEIPEWYKLDRQELHQKIEEIVRIKYNINTPLYRNFNDR
jgi:regulator of protease activity HflC (stomatin/prohibitin superfamily)